LSDGPFGRGGDLQEVQIVLLRHLLRLRLQPERLERIYLINN
jgi:hypothetical protein